VSSDNDELEYDLSAFEAPEPPAGIADAVIARLDGTAVTPAVPAEPHSGKRRGWLIAGVAVACLAVVGGTYALIQGTRRAGTARGDVVAEKARTLSLDGVSAELDPGAHVTWQRRGELLDVEQREGAAAWRVDADTTLRIDAGAMVASVEATGASLRVEVSMNATDVRVIGASALTAAVVSMVTVTVYTGHVKLSERGQTVIVQPGETRSVVPERAAPPPPEPVVAGAPLSFDRGRGTIADVLIPAGESSTINVSTVPLLVEVDAAGRCPGAVEVYRDGAKLSGPIVMLDAGMHGYAVRCAGDTKNVAVGSLVVVAGGGHIPLSIPRKSSEPMVYLAQPVHGAEWADPLAVAGQTLSDAIVSVGSVVVPVSGDGRFVANVARPASLTFALRIEHAQQGIHYVVVRGKPKTVTVASSCDEVSCVLNNYEGVCCEKLKSAPTPKRVDAADTCDETSCVLNGGACCEKFKKGGTNLSRDDIAATIAGVKADIAACGAKSTSSGKVVVKVKVRPDGKVSASSTTKTYDPKVSGCVLDIFKKLAFPATDDGGTFSYPFVFAAPQAPGCNAEVFKEQGMEQINKGQHAEALASFEKALECKDDPYIRQLAFMEACGSKNVAKAKQYYVLLSKLQQAKFEQICIRNGVDAKGGPAPSGMGSLQVLSRPEGAKVLVDGKSTGLTTPVTGSALKLTTGKHKVTLIVGDDRFTWPVTIKEGEMATIEKVLE
jgi:ferric-dicitrate binding protein FerR (iron transport regulator)